MNVSRRSHSCVFYGDLYPNHECFDARTSAGLSRLLAARKHLAYGLRTDYFTQHNCIGFVRAGTPAADGHQRHSGCVVLVSNATRRSRALAPVTEPKAEDGKLKTLKPSCIQATRRSILLSFAGCHLTRQAPPPTSAAIIGETGILISKTRIEAS